MRFAPVQLCSERLCIKQADISDAERIVEYYSKNREYLQPFEPTRPDFFITRQFWVEQIKQGILDFQNDKALRLFIFQPENSQKIIGVINFSNFIRGVFQATYLGYSIDQDYQGRGFMTEALQTAIRFVFSELNFHRIMANCMVSNQPSLAVLKKLGFVIEGKAREYLQINGKWEDHILTALINKEYRR